MESKHPIWNQLRSQGVIVNSSKLYSTHTNFQLTMKEEHDKEINSWGILARFMKLVPGKYVRGKDVRGGNVRGKNVRC